MSLIIDLNRLILATSMQTTNVIFVFQDPDNKKRVYRHLAETECQDFYKLISHIKIT